MGVGKCVGSLGEGGRICDLGLLARLSLALALTKPFFNLLPPSSLSEHFTTTTRHILAFPKAGGLNPRGSKCLRKYKPSPKHCIIYAGLRHGDLFLSSTKPSSHSDLVHLRHIYPAWRASYRYIPLPRSPTISRLSIWRYS